MTTVRTVADVRRALASLRATMTIGLVPTMGAFHDGHVALFRAAREACDVVVASLFVNPAQFGDPADLSAYPRDEARDEQIASAAGVDFLFAPSAAEMYPTGFATWVDVEGPARGLEGDFRPGHFRGVATVCARLFGQVRPDRAYFGEKDWQQLQVVRRMVADLLLPLEIIGVPTVREPDGLALSSRNRFLGSEQRVVAPRLHGVLRTTADALAAGGAADAVLADARRSLSEIGFAVDYLALVDGASLQALPVARRGARLIAAAALGSVRLLDNVAV
jgi:pantoate--beta-alanine ligase